MTSENVLIWLRHRARVWRAMDRSYNAICADEAATLIESQASEIAELRERVSLAEFQTLSHAKDIKDLRNALAYAEDAAAKGDLARQQAGGMEMEIKELQQDKKRLDWVDSQNWTPEGAINLIFSTSIRQGIDAAMAETKP